MPAQSTWATTANQTVANSTKEANRVQLNGWLRSGAPIVAGAAVAAGTQGATTAGQSGHPLYGLWEITDRVETARDSGIWKAGYTSDGLHPNSTGVNDAKQGVNYTMIG